MKNKLLKAFTLLEMLVVIGIIAILVSLGAVSYSTAQKKARDSKRKTDLSTIRNAMEQYYSICGYKYPAKDGAKIPTSIICTSPTTTIMSTVPKDPKTGVSYDMTQTTTSDYTICVTPNTETQALESESGATYCLSNQQ